MSKPGWTVEPIEGNRSLASWRVVSVPMSRMQADTLLAKLVQEDVARDDDGNEIVTPDEEFDDIDKAFL